MSEEKSKPMRFFATYPFEVDSKRRLQVPVKWRPPVQEERVGGTLRKTTQEVEFMLTLSRVGNDSYACITAIPADVFEAYAQQVEGLPLMDPMAVRLRRFLGSRSEPVTMDAAGRITLPKWMADKVGIGQKGEDGKDSSSVVLRGEVDRFSIWSKQKADADELANEEQDDSALESQI